LVDITYGRIGTRGTLRRYVAKDEACARKLLRYHLRRRTTAKKRIGVSYRVSEVIDPKQWVSLQKNAGLVNVSQSCKAALRHVSPRGCFNQLTSP
jgi:hypothetical protein